MKTTRIIIAIIIVVGILIISYLINAERELEEITVKLKWLHQAQFAGNYVANEKGFYVDQDLKVNLIPLSSEEGPIDAVINGKADFGITGASELIVAREKGLPVKAFAVIYKISPICAYALKESNITKPEDFVGKIVGLEDAADIKMSYSAMMTNLGINRSQINEVTIGQDATELLNGITDVSTGYIINEPHQAIEAGYGVNIISMADYGVNMYADVLFATEDTINNKPELVESFLRATLKGWEYVTEDKNKKEGVDIILKYAIDRTKSHEEYMLQSSIPLIYEDETTLGWMEKSEWEKIQDLLLEFDILDEPLNIEDAYTMEFLEKVYGEE